jgi:hypothetical protein
MIALSVVNHASVVSGAPMNVRLLAGSQSSHAPHPAHLRCLSDLGVLIYAFSHQVRTERKDYKMNDSELEDAYNAGCQTTAQFGICNCCFPELDDRN